MSALAWLWYVRSGGGANRVINTDNGAQERKFVGGTQLIADRVAERLGRGTMGVVRLGAPVRSISGWNVGLVAETFAERMACRPSSSSSTPLRNRHPQNANSVIGDATVSSLNSDAVEVSVVATHDSCFLLPAAAQTIPTRFGPVPAPLNDAADVVTITTRSGEAMCARYVIVAMAPTLYGRLEWDPPLPPILQQAVQRMPMGACIKTHTFYRTAWWRERGYSGSIFCGGDSDGPVAYTMDDCKPDGSRPCLMGFVVAGQQKLLTRMTRAERVVAITKQYAAVFKCDDALHPIDYIDADWSEDVSVLACVSSRGFVWLFDTRSQPLFHASCSHSPGAALQA